MSRNLRIIENLKSELLEDIATLYRHLADPVLEDTRDVAADTLSEMIVICYLLGKRLGVDFSTMDRHIAKKIRLGLINENEIEKYFGDLSELARVRSGELHKK
ncbi:MazG-like family protein [Thermoclostridium stercorarium]|uniref:MazG-like family protein n=1 Tax=Thermoclostridium stercorarium TaxID=1510 RepID=UPI001FA7D975|nr:MazG-like family protein [Thermoclostridium stercorarium]